MCHVPLSLTAHLSSVMCASASSQHVFSCAISSNTEPLLLEFEGQPPFTKSQVILKIGDDLRRDCMAMAMCRVFNAIWRAGALQYEGEAVEVLEYRYVPEAWAWAWAMGNGIGSGIGSVWVWA